MDREHIAGLLAQYKAGALSEQDMMDTLTALPFHDLGFARVDTHRALRQGVPEVIFCQGKTSEQIASIAQSILNGGADGLLATRAAPENFLAVKACIPAAQYHERARLIVVPAVSPPQLSGQLFVVSAGTADMPVAEEAALTAEFLGCPTTRLYDVGVAGLHRLLAHFEALQKADAIIVVAGMEGALASVVGGLTAAPLIAVPTSVGYGASFGGLAALLSMLNSCASGMAVCNIDNGFGAAMLAGKILRKIQKA